MPILLGQTDLSFNYSKSKLPRIDHTLSFMPILVNFIGYTVQIFGMASIEIKFLLHFFNFWQSNIDHHAILDLVSSQIIMSQKYFLLQFISSVEFRKYLYFSKCTIVKVFLNQVMFDLLEMRFNALDIINRFSYSYHFPSLMNFCTIELILQIFELVRVINDNLYALNLDYMFTIHPIMLINRIVKLTAYHLIGLVDSLESILCLIIVGGWLLVRMKHFREFSEPFLDNGQICIVFQAQYLEWIVITHFSTIKINIHKYQYQHAFCLQDRVLLVVLGMDEIQSKGEANYMRPSYSRKLLTKQSYIVPSPGIQNKSKFVSSPATPQNRIRPLLIKPKWTSDRDKTEPRSTNRRQMLKTYVANTTKNPELNEENPKASTFPHRKSCYGLSFDQMSRFQLKHIDKPIEIKQHKKQVQQLSIPLDVSNTNQYNPTSRRSYTKNSPTVAASPAKRQSISNLSELQFSMILIQHQDTSKQEFTIEQPKQTLMTRSLAQIVKNDYQREQRRKLWQKTLSISNICARTPTHLPKINNSIAQITSPYSSHAMTQGLNKLRRKLKQKSLDLK